MFVEWPDSISFSSLPFSHSFTSPTTSSHLQHQHAIISSNNHHNPQSAPTTPHSLISEASMPSKVLQPLKFHDLQLLPTQIYNFLPQKNHPSTIFHINPKRSDKSTPWVQTSTSRLFFLFFAMLITLMDIPARLLRAVHVPPNSLVI